MRKYLKIFGKWLERQLAQFFLFVKKIILGTPDKLRHWVFSFANWGKQQLDKRINRQQRENLHKIIFESETQEGRQFDTIITWVIVASIFVVILETVSDFHRAYWWFFYVLEWLFTIIFTVEYILRLYSARQPAKYATSFFGLVDLLAILPSYLSIFFLGAQNLMIVRAFRLLRVFRIFKMGHFVSEGEVIVSALKASKTKIYVFISFVLLLAMIVGSILYIVEGGANPGFDNIPKGIYWAITTLTTVGYGDVTPITPLGKFLASFVMVMGYDVIAVPTGIVTAEISGRIMNLKEVVFQACPSCNLGEHHTGATFCHGCGNKL